MARPLVIGFCAFDARSMVTMSALPPCCTLITSRRPSGEKRGLALIESTEPKACREPVSRLITCTRGWWPLAWAMKAISWLLGE